MWLTGSQARYVSVVRHHRGSPTRMTIAAIDRAAVWPRLFSARQKKKIKNPSTARDFPHETYSDASLHTGFSH